MKIQIENVIGIEDTKYTRQILSDNPNAQDSVDPFADFDSLAADLRIQFGEPNP